jgi:hypothetical protein
MRQMAITTALAALAVFTVMALHPASAAACKAESPCTSPTEKVLCPFTSAGNTGTGVATFNIPKDARVYRREIRDAGVGGNYDEAHPICSGTTMAVTTKRTPGATEDTYEVIYTLTSTGASNPAESHDVFVTLAWQRESDLAVTKVLLGSGDSIGAEEEATFSIGIRNNGPAPTNGFDLSDVPNPAAAKAMTVTGVEQVVGPKATQAPAASAEGVVKGKWDKLEPQEEIVVLVHVRFKPGQGFANIAGASHDERSERVEPDGKSDNNLAVVKFDVKPAPDSKIGAAGASGASGNATPPPRVPAQTMRIAPGAGLSGAGLKKVQVAIMRLGGGKPLDGGLPENPTKKSGTCKWVANRKGKLAGRARSEHGVCDSPLWLKATGTTHWKLHLQHALPSGRYVVYSRAVAASGVAESLFTAKDGNRKAIFVH